MVRPDRHDPRLRLSAVIATLQVLGQTVLGFKVSVAQILVTVALCALVDFTVTLARQHVLALPSSGMLTGNSVAFILRASGTRHGDWWSLHGIQFFVLAALVSLLSKYLIRPAGRHLFNPSNVGIVWCLLVIGPTRVFPQYLWWGPFRGPVMAAMAVILLGGAWVLRPVRMVPMAASFLLTFGALIAAFAVAGRSFIAIWHAGPVGGASYWLDLCLSPEILIFVFFMMSDPQTAPRSARGRVVYGAATAAVAAALLLPQTTEFGVKLAILSSLTVLCALVPALDRAAERRIAPAGATGTAGRDRAPRPWSPKRLGVALLNPAIAAAVIIAAAAPVETYSLAGNRQLVNIERGFVGKRNAQ